MWIYEWLHDYLKGKQCGYSKLHFCSNFSPICEANIVERPSLYCTFLENLTYCEFASFGLRSLGRSAEVTGIPSPTSAYNTELDSRAWRLLEVNPSTVGLVQNYFRFRARYFESHWTTKTKFSKYSLIRRRRPDKNGRCDGMGFHLGVQSWQDSALWQIDPGKKEWKISLILVK